MFKVIYHRVNKYFILGLKKEEPRAGKRKPIVDSDNEEEKKGEA